MQILLLFWSMIAGPCFASVTPSYQVIPLSGYGRSKFVNAINALRFNPPRIAASPPLNLVQYNYEFEAGLVEFIKATSVKFLYQNWRDIFTVLPELSSLSSFRGKGWGLWFKDSCYAHAGGTGIGVNVINRIQQGNKCFDYRLCSRTEFTGYQTCGTKLTNETGKCTNWSDYYPAFLLSSPKFNMACVVTTLFKSGAPSNHKASYLCFTNLTHSFGKDDRPYPSTFP